MLGFCFQEAFKFVELVSQTKTRVLDCISCLTSMWKQLHSHTTPVQPCAVFLSKRLFKKPPFPAAGDRAVFTGFVSRVFCFLIYHSSDLVKTKGDIGSQGTDKKKEVNIVESFFLLFNAWPHTYTGFLLHSARWDSHYGNGDVDGVHFRSLQGSHLPQGKAS